MKRPILFSILGLISLTMLSLFSGCIKSPEGPPTHEDSINAYRCFEIVQEYLPYTEGDSLIFVSDNGQKDTLVCTRLTGELYGAKVELTRVTEWHSGTGRWKLSSQYLYCEINASGMSETYYDGVTYNLSGYLRDSVNAGEIGFYKTFPDVESITEQYPVIRLDKNYYGFSQLPSGSYMKIRYHKGLTEFSLDGQEIWRLVEE